MRWATWDENYAVSKCCGARMGRFVFNDSLPICIKCNRPSTPMKNSFISSEIKEKADGVVEEVVFAGPKYAPMELKERSDIDG